MLPTRMLLCPFVPLLCIAISAGQSVRETSVPLGDALDRALKTSCLTAPESRPFHLKVHLFESTNPPSDYRAEIEEYWVSPQQWRRTIEAPQFKQLIIVNGVQTSEQNTGDYYPLWLRNFVKGIFDPVPQSNMWSGTKISQITMSNGQHTEACARLKFKVGSADVQNDAFANICFDAVGLLSFVGMPGYGMEFHDYKRFGKQTIARRYQNDPEPGTKIVASVVVLEEYRNASASLFAVDKPTPEAQMLMSVRVDQKTIEAASAGHPPLTWPKVQSGKTEGVLSMYISVDREGKVREAYPLNADNAGLQDSARDQLLTWKLKPMTAGGVPIQAEAALTFRFQTSLVSGDAQTPVSQSSSALHLSPGLVSGFLIEDPPPVYPEAAKQNHVQGKVVLDLIINQEGRTQNIEVLTSPDPSLTDAAIAAVSRWRYRPYQLNGIPVAIQSTVEVNFQLH